MPFSIASELDPGEREAIALALQLTADAVVIDEASGRREANRQGRKVVGTLGILERAHDTGLLDLRTALRKLQSTSFFLSPALLARILQSRY